MNDILLADNDYEYSRSLTRFQSFFHVRDGIYRPIERAQKKHRKSRFSFYHPSPAYQKLICRRYDWHASAKDRGHDYLYSPENLTLCQKIERLSHQLEEDIPSWLQENQADLHSSKILQKYCTGKIEDLLIHRSVELGEGMLFDTRNGKIILEKGVSVSPFSSLTGPLFVGTHSQLINLRMSRSIVGIHCRLGGEISDCLIGDFTNKYHDGFIGHSLIGQWVNLAAMTTISDLKNTYGNVRLSLPPSNNREKTSIDTERIKFGAIIGDWTKTAIGTMISCGSNIDAAAHIFAQSRASLINGYVHPLSWGKINKYQREKFIQSAKKIAARRSQELPSDFADFVQQLALACPSLASEHSEKRAKS